ncbi:hypothetical protein F2Q69_00029162 [Brassica cretica]|uniref:Uncharacterized protein n=1 Tax=Brassica cretica TaxID=69181 RepID=A0A8S9RU94_BRACR|nr:hypothetical protein F2Q69_00029162 [Brassica cretica]
MPTKMKSNESTWIPAISPIIRTSTQTCIQEGPGAARIGWILRGDPSDEDRSWPDGAKQEDSVLFSHSLEVESRKKARESPGVDTETMKAEIVRWLTGLTSNMVEGLSRCENTLKTQIPHD